MYVVSLLLIVLLIALAWLARKLMMDWMKSSDSAVGPAFTLADLRRLHQEGHMTDSEYERAKELILRQSQKPQAPAHEDKGTGRRRDKGTT
jgi:hypothetical protein